MRNEIWIFVVAAWNIATFLLYGWDKLAAKKHWSRIRESLLLFAALLFGSFGALSGMVVWNHKTSKMKFRLLIPLMTIAHILLFGWLFRAL